jgi:alcohol dehydrogenase class IV
MNPLLHMPRVIFDFGAVRALKAELDHLGLRRPLLVTDRGLVACGVFEQVTRALPEDTDYRSFEDIPENPTVEGVERAFAVYEDEACDGVVAIGGGSVIDSAKAVALLAGHGGSLHDYLGRPDRVGSAVAPLIAIPTTAGTGSEASRGAGIHPDAETRSTGISGPVLVPRVAICDPELTFTLPPHLTAATGMDALSHCIEGFLAKPINPVADAIALDGIRRVCTYLEPAVINGDDRQARWHMLMAALEGGLVSKGLGPAHALALTLSDRGLHHGMLCTLCVPPVLRTFAGHIDDKLAQLAAAMNAAPGESAADRVEAMNRRFGLPGTLREIGYGQADLDEIADAAAQSFFNHHSPYHPSQAEYRRMLDAIAG